uniref:Uncharacterized protein n=1 Tax=Meloidogyne enterolobii TaxID=390850 RepID=A0A6V7UFZ7_MELEN|nr:unnamed protein product [Meloidogyne enterolobii]
MQICTKVPKYAKICCRNPVPNLRTDVKTPFLKKIFKKTLKKVLKKLKSIKEDEVEQVE